MPRQNQIFLSLQFQSSLEQYLGPAWQSSVCTKRTATICMPFNLTFLSFSFQGGLKNLISIQNKRFCGIARCVLIENTFTYTSYCFARTKLTYTQHIRSEGELLELVQFFEKNIYSVAFNCRQFWILDGLSIDWNFVCEY